MVKTPLQGEWVQSLVGELRFCLLCGTAKKLINKVLNKILALTKHSCCSVTLGRLAAGVGSDACASVLVFHIKTMGNYSQINLAPFSASKDSLQACSKCSFV